jgi:hypothetical protein
VPIAVDATITDLGQNDLKFGPDHLAQTIWILVVILVAPMCSRDDRRCGNG